MFVDEEYFEVGVDEVGGSPGVELHPADAGPGSHARGTAHDGDASRPGSTAAPARRPLRPLQNQLRWIRKPAQKSPRLPAAEGTRLTAPMPGMIVSYEKKVGDAVSEGETVVILEAMKMENALPAPVSGTIKAINLLVGDSVAKSDALCHRIA